MRLHFPKKHALCGNQVHRFDFELKPRFLACFAGLLSRLVTSQKPLGLGWRRSRRGHNNGNKGHEGATAQLPLPFPLSPRRAPTVFCRKAVATSERVRRVVPYLFHPPGTANLLTCYLGAVPSNYTQCDRRSTKESQRSRNRLCDQWGVRTSRKHSALASPRCPPIKVSSAAVEVQSSSWQVSPPPLPTQPRGLPISAEISFPFSCNFKTGGWVCAETFQCLQRRKLV